jgi:hypothetical protein
MTNRKHLKSRVRDRMAKTGERYAAARANVVADRVTAGPTAMAGRDLAGIHPETAAMRVVAAAAGVRDPATGAPPSEELLFVVAGGVGAGVFAFQYPDASTLFLNGRHRLDDSRGFVVGGLERLGLSVEVRETSGPAAARRNLAEALDAGPAIAWCDSVELGTRGLPPTMSGGGYHVVTVLAADDADGTVTIADLRGGPEIIDAERFARARARIAKDRNRVAWVVGSSPVDPAGAVRAGLAATVAELRHPRTGSFGIEAFRRLADRMTARTGRDAWTTAFPPGRRLGGALRSLYEYIETYGTGGGLMRPMYARGLEDAARITADARLAAIAGRYAGLGRRWSEVAAAALPVDVGVFDATRWELHERIRRYGDGASAGELAAGWTRLEALEASLDAAFPLSEAAVRDLLGRLSARLDEIADLETAALDELEAAAGD